MINYYVSNGQSNVDYGWILKSTGKTAQGENTTVVIDELSNVGIEFEVFNSGIVEISQEDYKELYELNKAFESSDVMECYQLCEEINRLLAKYIK